MITVKGRRVLAAFEVAQHTNTIIGGVILRHEWDSCGNHRLAYGEKRVGAWAGYQSIAVLTLNQGKYGAVTSYHDGCGIPSVFKIVEH